MEAGQVCLIKNVLEWGFWGWSCQAKSKRMQMVTFLHVLGKDMMSTNVKVETAQGR